MVVYGVTGGHYLIDTSEKEFDEAINKTCEKEIIKKHMVGWLLPLEESISVLEQMDLECVYIPKFWLNYQRDGYYSEKQESQLLSVYTKVSSEKYTKGLRLFYGEKFQNRLGLNGNIVKGKRREK